MSHHVHGLTQTYKVNCFISGLKDALKYEMMAKKPTTMVEVMRLAKLEEQKNVAIKKSTKSNAYKAFVGGAGGVNIGIGSKQKSTATSTVATTVYPVKKLTQQELRERREKGLCFSCDEKYTPCHKCKNQKLFRLEILQMKRENRRWKLRIKLNPQILRLSS